MLKVNMREAKTKLSTLLAKVEQDDNRRGAQTQISRDHGG